jgi:hypothetical protein
MNGISNRSVVSVGIGRGSARADDLVDDAIAVPRARLPAGRRLEQRLEVDVDFGLHVLPSRARFHEALRVDRHLAERLRLVPRCARRARHADGLPSAHRHRRDVRLLLLVRELVDLLIEIGDLEIERIDRDFASAASCTLSFSSSSLRDISRLPPSRARACPPPTRASPWRRASCASRLENRPCLRRRGRRIASDADGGRRASAPTRGPRDDHEASASQPNAERRGVATLLRR